ncbi:MAG TPA: Usg family protein [Kiloniellales bacterium]|nr:Usg family protein [Kiloniellales bacterium]
MRVHESALALQLRGYRLATAEILYHMPDHPGVLQQFVWQHMDIAPDYPRLQKFLDYWRRNIEAVLHSVKVGRVELIRPAEIRLARAEFRLH